MPAKTFNLVFCKWMSENIKVNERADNFTLGKIYYFFLKGGWVDYFHNCESNVAITLFDRKEWFPNGKKFKVNRGKMLSILIKTKKNKKSFDLP